MRQVVFMLNEINKRRHNDFVCEASLHGIKLKPIGRIDSVETPDLSEDELKAMDKMLAERQKDLVRKRRG